MTAMLRQAAYALCVSLATLVFALTLLPLALATWLSVLAYRAWPGPTWGNCWTYAAAEWVRRIDEWCHDGMPVGLEPRVVGRASRHRPRWIPHALLGDPVNDESDLMALDSYKPTDPTEEPWWRAWMHFFFAGGVKRGDVPSRH